MVPGSLMKSPRGFSVEEVPEGYSRINVDDVSLSHIFRVTIQ